ncbi:hypothetical protein DY052_07535 [Apilactobacillus timberlakei]|uniref:hypothetical protein n=1 Tax=Apilactobacillus timberlakei TaxID=2008380 RepID=UPI00112C5AC2|nr:hypothetical protein [Apilactobacillus timberlakei]TPR13705.1 hypothetical protein DY052_07535 [Apilactobacillus timberlakei]
MLLYILGALLAIAFTFLITLGQACNAISQILKCLDDLKKHVEDFKKMFNFAKKNNQTFISND